MVILIVAQAKSGAWRNWRKNVMPVAESGPFKDQTFEVRVNACACLGLDPITQNQNLPLKPCAHATSP